MKHGLPSSSSYTTSPAVATSTRSLQGDLTPTQLISAQFLEMDTSPNMQIINHDDQYVNVTFPDQSKIVLQFSSISNLLDPSAPLSDQMEYVPGGAILWVLRRVERLLGKIMWTYTMGCRIEDYCVGWEPDWLGLICKCLSLLCFSIDAVCLLLYTVLLTLCCV